MRKALPLRIGIAVVAALALSLAAAAAGQSSATSATDTSTTKKASKLTAGKSTAGAPKSSAKATTGRAGKSGTTRKVSSNPASKRVASRRRRRRFVERFYTSSFASDVTSGDVTAGEDATVRWAAVDALGNMNGTVVAIDPANGRVLTMVNQRLALSEGAEPCSTIKLAVALAGLSENVINKDTEIPIGRRSTMNLSRALAVSNNTYFENLGRKLGFEKVQYYARQFGLGELAGWKLEGEHLGEYPSAALEARRGGVGKMCSYGEGISMTPLQLGAMMAAIANGGTLYYLQHPDTPEEAAGLQPVVKRQLDIAPYLEDLSEGLADAVSWGTARTVNYHFSEEPILGKTGTCSNNGTRLGWFASFANTRYRRVVVVVFLRGGRPTYGPRAAEIAGKMYRTLYEHSFFAEPAVTSGTAAGSTP